MDGAAASTEDLELTTSDGYRSDRQTDAFGSVLPVERVRAQRDYFERVIQCSVKSLGVLGWIVC